MQGRTWLRLEVRGRAREERNSNREGRGWRSGRGHTHLKHVFHFCDVGKVEVQRLVELFRALPSRKGGHTEQDGVLAGRREGGGRGGGASRTQGSRSAGGRVEGTHFKHLLHARDAGRVEAQRLVELLRALPRVAREDIRSRVRGGRGGERAVGAVVELAARREAAR